MTNTNATLNPTSMSMLQYMVFSIDHMIDNGLDMLEDSENPIVQHMNQRVDEIQHTMKESMKIPSIMEFVSMSVMLPLIGIIVFLFLLDMMLL